MPSSSSDAIHRPPLADLVYSRIREEILRGDLEDGSVLSQVQLAERYGVSRIPVREALRRLQAESLVVATPYHAYLVRKLSPEQVLELADIRVVVEDLALSQHGPFSAEAIEAMRVLNTEMSQDAHGPAFLALDRQLHQLMVGAGSMTAELLNEIRDKVQRYLSMVGPWPSRRETAVQEHEQIIGALEAGDRERARELLRTHIHRSRDFIAEKVVTAPPP